MNCVALESAGKMVENATGADEIGEEFFFGTEFGRVGDEAAAGAARWMLDVKHLVVEDIFAGDLRNGGVVHAAIQEDLIGAGIVAAELAAPAFSAPADVGALQTSGKIPFVQLFEHFFEVEVSAARARGCETHAPSAHAADAAAGAAGARVVQVRLDQCVGLCGDRRGREAARRRPQEPGVGRAAADPISGRKPRLLGDES